MAYNPAQILIAVESLRPGLVNTVDFELGIIDADPFVSAWHRQDVSEPTQAEIEAVDTDALLYQLGMPILSASQIRTGFYNEGVLEQVEAAITTAEQPIKIAWQYNAAFQRADPVTVYLMGELGWAASQMDEFFYSTAA